MWLKSKYYQMSFVILCVMMETLNRFRGNSLSFYSDLNVGALFSDNYLQDIYVSLDILQTLPMLYITKLVSFDNDLSVFLILSCFSLLNTALIYKILRAITDNSVFIFSFLTVLIFVDISPIEMVQTSPIAFSLKPTVVSHSLLFLTLYLVVTQRLNMALAVSVLSVFVNIKLGWAPYIFVLCYFGLCALSQRDRQKIMLAVGSLLSVAIFVLATSGGGEYIAQVVIERNGNEDLLSYHPPLHSFGLFALLATIGYLAYRSGSDRRFLASYAIVLSLFFSVYLYQLFLFDKMPIAQLSLISIVRNLNIVVFLALILLCNIRKSGPISMFDVMAVTALVLAARLPLLSFALTVVILALTFRMSFVAKLRDLTAYKYLFFLLICLLFVKSIFDTLPNSDKFQKISSDTYTNSLPESVEELVLESVSHSSMLLHLKQSGKTNRASINGKLGSLPALNGFIPITKTNTQVRRSKFIGDFAHFYDDEEMFDEHLARLDTVRYLSCVIKSGPVSCSEQAPLPDNLDLLVESLSNDMMIETQLTSLGYDCRTLMSGYTLCLAQQKS